MGIEAQFKQRRLDNQDRKWNRQMSKLHAERDEEERKKKEEEKKKREIEERAAAEDRKRRRVFVPSAAAVADPSLYFTEYQAFQKNPDGVSKAKNHQSQPGQMRHQEQQPQKLPQQEPAMPANNNGGVQNRQRAGGGFD